MLYKLHMQSERMVLREWWQVDVAKIVCIYMKMGLILRYIFSTLKCLSVLSVIILYMLEGRKCQEERLMAFCNHDPAVGRQQRRDKLLVPTLEWMNSAGVLGFGLHCVVYVLLQALKVVMLPDWYTELIFTFITSLSMWNRPLMKGPLQTIDLSNDEEVGDSSDMPLVLLWDLQWGAVEHEPITAIKSDGPIQTAAWWTILWMYYEKGFGQLSIKAPVPGEGRQANEFIFFSEKGQNADITSENQSDTRLPFSLSVNLN